MRSLHTGIFLAILLLIFAAAAHADQKIGFIDSEKIFAGYQGTSQAQVEFNAEVEKWTQEVEGRRRELEQINEQFQSQSLILSEAKRREREDEIQHKRSELDAFVQDIWGPNGKIAQRNEQLTRPIVEKIREVLMEIAEADGYSLVLDATDGNVVYADRALDLTEQVLTRLNQLPREPVRKEEPQGQNE